VLTLILIYLALGALLSAAALQRRAPRLRSIAAGLLVSYAVIALLFGAGELFFRYAYAEPDGLPTLALRNWLDRHWQLNSAGYRDREWDPEAWAQRRTVVLVGDSFTAGWGIEDPADRFGDVLAARLGAGWAVINLGKEGTATPGQLAQLQALPLAQPDWIIWQYTLNDIDDAALSIGLDPGLNPFAEMPALAGESYLANFLYWRLAGAGTRGHGRYVDWLFSMYDHAVVWQIHAEQLNAVIDEVERRGAELAVVIFPDMFFPFDSIPYVDRVAQVFEARGYGDRVLKLFDQAEAMPLAERIVSPRDGHPSAAFSRLVGDVIYARWFAGEGAS
jgi:hypothetical protein